MHHYASALMHKSRQMISLAVSCLTTESTNEECLNQLRVRGVRWDSELLFLNLRVSPHRKVSEEVWGHIPIDFLWMYSSTALWWNDSVNDFYCLWESLSCSFLWMEMASKSSFQYLASPSWDQLTSKVLKWYVCRCEGAVGTFIRANEGRVWVCPHLLTGDVLLCDFFCVCLCVCAGRDRLWNHQRSTCSTGWKVDAAC